MKQETFLLLGIGTIGAIAFLFGGRNGDHFERVFNRNSPFKGRYCDTPQTEKFISLEMAEIQNDTLTTNY
jgi:hypothetical protein